MKLLPSVLEGVGPARELWARDGGLRLPELLPADDIARLLPAVEQTPHSLLHSLPPAMGFFYAATSISLDSPGALGEAVATLFGPLREWLNEVSGLPLVPPADGQVALSLLRRGHFLDAHNDYDGARAVAVVLGLTEGEWPQEEGGWLEFLDIGPKGVIVTEARPPRLNTLDVFDVRGVRALHRVTQLLTHRDRRALTFWFYLRDETGSAAT